jgi:hypothetical protein
MTERGDNDVGVGVTQHAAAAGRVEVGAFESQLRPACIGRGVGHEAARDANDRLSSVVRGLFGRHTRKYGFRGSPTSSTVRIDGRSTRPAVRAASVACALFA